MEGPGRRADAAARGARGFLAVGSEEVGNSFGGGVSAGLRETALSRSVSLGPLGGRVAGNSGEGTFPCGEEPALPLPGQSLPGGARRAGHSLPWRCPVNLFLFPRLRPPRPGLFPARVVYGVTLVAEPSRGNSRPSATPWRIPEGGTPGSLPRSVRGRPAGPVFPSHALPPFPPGVFPAPLPPRNAGESPSSARS